MSDLVLMGLDGGNPLAFLAALGALNVLADRGGVEPRLAWLLRGTYRPVLIDGPSAEELVAAIVADRDTFADEPALQRLRYAKDGIGAEAHDLKPPPSVFVEYLRDMVVRRSKRSASYAAAFATDVARDGKGNTKPTALHFTAGQQEFLGMVDELRGSVNADDVREALIGPWRYLRPLPVLQWDNASSRDYALRATDPAGEKKLGVPGADWLAFRGLPFFRVFPRRDRAFTTGFAGGWKDGVFRWPMWNVPISRPVLSSLLSSQELWQIEPKVQQARGIDVVFEASVRRSDQGGYGSFSPARVARSTSAEQLSV